MAAPERDTYYTRDGTERRVVERESNATAWFVGIIVALALLAIGYLVFSANSGPSPTTNIQNAPAVTSPATPDNGTTPMTSPETTAPSTTTPMTTAPADNGTSTDNGASTAAPANNDNSTTAPAPAAPAPATPAAPAAQ